MTATLLVPVILVTALVSGGGVALYGWLNRLQRRFKDLEARIQKNDEVLNGFRDQVLSNHASIARLANDLVALEQSFIKAQTAIRPFPAPEKKEPEDIATGWQRQRQRAEQGAALTAQGEIHVIG